MRFFERDRIYFYQECSTLICQFHISISNTNMQNIIAHSITFIILTGKHVTLLTYTSNDDCAKTNHHKFKCISYSLSVEKITSHSVFIF